MAHNSDSSPAPFLTKTLGIGGDIKSVPDDFVVEEIPTYELSGEGEWLFLQIEKRQLSTPQLVTHLARALGVSSSEIGTAGRKDSFAVTRQWVSVPARSFQSVDQIETDRISVLDQKLHGNKLRTGHLLGNRFRILLRNPLPEATERIGTLISKLRQTGFPNWFGEQRFGARDSSDEPGLKLLRGERVRRMRRDELRFALSAAQSRLFNHWGAARLCDGLAQTVISGDVMQVCASGGPFVVDDPAAEQARFDCRETVISGPMFGPKMKQPAGEAAERERCVLDDFGLDSESFTRFRKLTSGTRRPLLVFVDDLTAEVTGDGVLLTFSLPPGAYATSLLREVRKSD